MKPSAKRRRSKAQIKEERKQEEARKRELQAKLLAWDGMEAELEKQKHANKQLTEVNHKVGQLVEDGVIKQVADGGFEAVVDPDEREHIRSKRKSAEQKIEMPAQYSLIEGQPGSIGDRSQLRQSEVDELLDVDLGIE